MASSEGISEATGEKFPPADINGALNPGQNKNVEVDSGASHMATFLQMKKQAEEADQKKEREKKEGLQKLKSTIMISAVVVAVAVAVVAITKKLKEK